MINGFISILKALINSLFFLIRVIWELLKWANREIDRGINDFYKDKD